MFQKNPRADLHKPIKDRDDIDEGDYVKIIRNAQNFGLGYIKDADREKNKITVVTVTPYTITEKGYVPGEDSEERIIKIYDDDQTVKITKEEMDEIVFDPLVNDLGSLIQAHQLKGEPYFIIQEVHREHVKLAYATNHPQVRVKPAKGKFRRVSRQQLQDYTVIK